MRVRVPPGSLMKREMLNMLHHGLSTLRWRFRRLKVKHKLERDGDNVRVVMVIPAGVFKVTEFMTANEMIRWFEGFNCGSAHLE